MYDPEYDTEYDEWDEPQWMSAYDAYPREHYAGEVWDDETITAVGGAAKIVITGDVGAYCHLRCAGCGALIVVKGNVGPHTTLEAHGGACKVVVYGHVDDEARIIASGGSARVELLMPEKNVQGNPSIHCDGAGATVKR